MSVFPHCGHSASVRLQGMSRQRLSILRYIFIGISFSCVISVWALKPEGLLAFAVIALFGLTGIPAAMLSLHFMELKHRDRN